MWEDEFDDEDDYEDEDYCDYCGYSTCYGECLDEDDFFDPDEDIDWIEEE